jgi:hypothetical protein
MRVQTIDGSPVTAAHRLELQAGYATRFDALVEEHGKPNASNMSIFQSELEAFEKSLWGKFPCQEEVPYPSTPEAALAMMDRYGSALSFTVIKVRGVDSADDVEELVCLVSGANATGP